MSAVRRMKYEMMAAERKRRRSGPQTIEQQMDAMDLSQGDRDEVRRFQAFLADAGKPLPELIAKHGADYLGFTPEEVASITHQAMDSQEQPGGGV